MAMSAPYSIGQRVRFNKRCVLASNVPKHSQNYDFTALVSSEDDQYQGDGIIEKGTAAVVIDFAAHGTGTATNPIVRVAGRKARVHPNHIESM